MMTQLGNSRLIRRGVLAAKMRLNRHPRLKTAVSEARFKLWQAWVRQRGTHTHLAFDVHRTCFVDPVTIRYALPEDWTGLVSRKYANRGRILGGNWDLHRIPFEDTDIYKAFHAHFVEGQAWRETDLYRRVMGQIDRGHVLYGCKTARDYETKCAALDSIFEDIKHNGYRSQADIARAEHDPYKGEDEISVCIDRHGEFLFEDGRHRLAIAKVLGVRRIPVKITMVHKAWNDFRMEVLDYARTHGGHVYQRIPHPDLCEVPFTYGDRRWDVLRQHLPVRTGVVLDIGAHWGWFCHQFEDLGFGCHAVESSARNAYFLEKLRRAANKRFCVHCVSVFDYKQPTRFDVVLALSIFHHFIKERASFEKWLAFLRRLDMDAMFFEPHLPEEPQMVGAYRNLSNQDFVKLIMDNSCLTLAEHIGESEDGRRLYLLQRK